ncbi:Uncharacterised protein [Sphingobacterium spiritivorum]|uniref:Uncharacterized protein n=1 Tax=Sphingobacterium spiritivorum TaxID=258 RepID=A0A380CRH6_SPHSI|nr:hypothetical protein [Sphingobacterium spiritivorum]SUJ26519.1 Uncharacterised protein [Sphingobacterium spiritivorum]
MPSSYPEMWDHRFEHNVNDASNCTWLDGIDELDTEVIEVGSGTSTEKNIIHIPVSDFEPTVLVDNSAYPLAIEAYDDDEVTIKLHKFQTLPTELTDDQILGGSYPQIDAATNAHKEAILATKFTRAAHAMAPAGNTVATPVILTTGTGQNADTAAVGDRLKFVYDDIIALKNACDNAKPKMPKKRPQTCSV